MSDLSDQIETNAQAPKSVTVDGSTATQHSLKDQIEADKYLGAKVGATKSKFGVRIGQFTQPGTR